MRWDGRLVRALVIGRTFLGMDFVPYSGYSKIKCALRFILEVNEERGDFMLAQFARVSRLASPRILEEERETKQLTKSPLLSPQFSN
jgi:hypothetical protein